MAVDQLKHWQDGIDHEESNRPCFGYNHTYIGYILR